MERTTRYREANYPSVYFVYFDLTFVVINSCNLAFSMLAAAPSIQQPLCFCWLWKTAWHGDALTYQWSSYALVWVMACGLLCSIPLSKPVLMFLQWALRARFQHRHSTVISRLLCHYYADIKLTFLFYLFQLLTKYLSSTRYFYCPFQVRNMNSY